MKTYMAKAADQAQRSWVVVDATDLVWWLNQWDRDGGPADFDGDGIVGAPDLVMMLDALGYVE